MSSVTDFAELPEYTADAMATSRPVNESHSITSIVHVGQCGVAKHTMMRADEPFDIRGYGVDEPVENRIQGDNLVEQSSRKTSRS